MVPSRFHVVVCRFFHDASEPPDCRHMRYNVSRGHVCGLAAGARFAMASGDPARASGSAAFGWRARGRPDGDSVPCSWKTSGASSRSARHRRRPARPCLASVTSGGVGAPDGVGKGARFRADETDVSTDRDGSGAVRPDAARETSTSGGSGERADDARGDVASSSTSLTATTAASEPVYTPTGARLLPLWEHRPGSVPQQYALDGNAVRLLTPEESEAAAAAAAAATRGVSSRTRETVREFGRFGRNDAVALTFLDVQRTRASRFAARVRDAFLPSRDSVTEDYWAYARFRFIQRGASSCMTVFATQQMLRAVGLGATRRLPAAAAVNWVLKDGLGRLGKLSVATRFGREFDSDVKRFRFTSSVVYDCSSLIEMLTPFYPKRFLLLATIANVGKSVGITTANVVRAPIQRSFALEENLGEVTAKTSAQQVLADNLGLAAAVLATGLTGKFATPQARQFLPLVLFAPLATVDLYCIYRELKAVRLKTINRERGEIIAERFVRDGRVPGHETVAAAERLFIPARLDESDLPLRVAGLSEACPTRRALLEALRENPSAPYVLSYLYPEATGGAFWRRGRGGLGETIRRWKSNGNQRQMKGYATLALAKHATSADVMRAVLQVAHLRALPFRNDLGPDQARIWALSESRARAERDVGEFSNQLTESGWLAGKVLLSSAERAPYTVERGCVEAIEENLPEER